MEKESSSAERNSKEAFGLCFFDTKMDDESILSVLIDSLGQWDTRDPAKHKLESDIWDKCVLYGWSSQKAFFIIGDMEDNQNRIWYFAEGFLTRRNIRKIIKTIKGEDYAYYIRKILWKYTDQNRLEKYDSRAYLPIASAGVVTGVLSLLSFVFGSALWTLMTALITTASAITWGFYRYAKSLNAIDLRILALAFQYIIVLQTLPSIAIVTMIGLLLPLPTTFPLMIYDILKHIVYFAIMIVEAILVSFLFRLLASPWIERKLLTAWSRIRKETDGVYDSTLDSFPSLPVKLGNLATFQWYVAHNTGFFISHVFILIFIAFRLYGTDPMILGIITLFATLTWFILVSEGKLRGFEHIASTIEGYAFVFRKGQEGFIWGIKKESESNDDS